MTSLFPPLSNGIGQAVAVRRRNLHAKLLSVQEHLHTFLCIGVFQQDFLTCLGWRMKLTVGSSSPCYQKKGRI